MIRCILFFPLLALLAACARQGGTGGTPAESGLSPQVEGKTATLHLRTDRQSLSDRKGGV